MEAASVKCSSDASKGLRELARTLKERISTFSEHLELTRERMEDTARAFSLVDKAYEWSLETGKFVNRVKSDEGCSDTAAAQIQARLSSHPPLHESHFSEVLTLARKLDNDRLVDQVRAAQERHREAVDAVQAVVGGVPIASRRRSLPTLPSQECGCSCPRLSEIREHAEDLDDEWAGKRGLRRTSTWQYPAENFEDGEVQSADSDQQSKSSGEDCDLPPVPSFNSHLYCTDRGSNFSLDLSGAEPLITDPKAHK